MDPVIRCTTLPSYSRSLKGFLFHFSRRSIHFYRLSHSELDDIEKVAVRSSLRLPKTKNALLIKILRVLRIILVVLPEHPSDTKVLTMKMEILLEPTSNKLLRTGKYGDFDGYTSDDPILKLEILIKLWWKWRYLVPVESIHSPMLTLKAFNQKYHDNQKTYNTASATLKRNVMIKKSVSMSVRRSQRHMKAMLLNKDDQEIYDGY
ncbi:hypothetical protein Tco_0018930 [Tanacetum coccineum]